MINYHVIYLETMKPFNMNEKKAIKDIASLVFSNHLGFTPSLMRAVFFSHVSVRCPNFHSWPFISDSSIGYSQE